MTPDKARIGDGNSDAVLWLEDRFQAVSGLDHLPQTGGEYKIEGEWWRVVACTDRIECELLTK